MAYVNKAYQYHSHATVPVVIQQQQKQQQQQQLALQQSRASAQQPQSRVQSQSYSYQPQNAIRHVPVVYPSGRVYYSPQSALATGSRSSTMGARSNSTQSQSTTTRQSQSLGGSKASVVSKRSGKSSIQQEYHDKKVRGLLLAPYFGRGRVPYLIAIGLTVGGILFIIGAGVVFGLRFHNNIMLTIDKGEIFGPVLIVVGLVLLAGAMKFYFDAYSVSNKERRKVQYSAARDNMVRISVIDVNRRQPGEAIVSGTSTNEAVTRTPHRAAAMVSRPLNADRHSTSGRNQRSYASDKRDSEMMPRSGSGTPLSYLAARRQPIEEPIDNRNSATVREDVQAGQAHEIYSNSSIRPAAAPAPRGSTATSQRASAVPQSASAVPPPRASAVSQSASAVPPPR
uniref:Serine/arginine repetitive matrix protein 2 n=1 Tax=Macrostomum lignano TaxID=282301 RepID=A0A1I8H058_9PLAT